MIRTPLHLIAGGLGAGKTTLLRRLLAGDHGRLAVLVNEFGEMGIDGSVLRGRDVDLVELAGGCVCCSLAGEFEAAVREILERIRPEAVVVETTGVAEADALVADVEDLLPEVRLESVTVLVDADASARFPEVGHAERSQIESADLVLLNKCDLVDADARRAIAARLRSVNPDARLLETAFAGIDPELVLARVPAPGGRRRPAPAAAEHGHGVQAFTWFPPGPMRGACFGQAVSQWPESVYRAKGLVVLDGAPRLFSYVAGRWDLDEAPAGEPVLVWIGPDIERHRNAIVGSLARCAGREEDA